MQSDPVEQCVVPYVYAEEVLPVECGRDVGEYDLDVALYCVLPLLIWGGAFVATLIVFVECVGFSGAEGRVVVAAEYLRLEPSCSEESEYSVKVIQECVFVTCLDWVVEHVLASCVAEAEELFVPF